MPVLKIRRLEKAIEERTCGWARSRGWLAHKVRFGDAGYPDRLFINRFGFHCYLEFKRPGAEPDPIQHHRINQLVNRGVAATWTDNYNDAISWLYQFEDLHSPRLPVAGDKDASDPDSGGTIP